MTQTKLKHAIAEAERFLKRAKELKYGVTHSGDYYYGSKKTGFVKRASMDLTRALADLRRSDND